jgi:hypothetical protein
MHLSKSEQTSEHCAALSQQMATTALTMMTTPTQMGSAVSWQMPDFVFSYMMGIWEPQRTTPQNNRKQITGLDMDRARHRGSECSPTVVLDLFVLEKIKSL